MNHLNVNSDPSFLQLPDSLTTSPSQSTFMAEEDASICPLLHNTSSPQLFNHPLTPSPGVPTDNSEYIHLCRNGRRWWRHQMCFFLIQLTIKLKMMIRHRVVRALEWVSHQPSALALPIIICTRTMFIRWVASRSHNHFLNFFAFSRKMGTRKRKDMAATSTLTTWTP